MNLKNTLGQINSNGGNSFHGRRSLDDAQRRSKGAIKSGLGVLGEVARGAAGLGWASPILRDVIDGL